MKFAKANGIRCIVNPAPAQPIDFKEVGATDYFIPNESEAEAITGMPVRSIDDARKCAEFLLRQGMRRVVITLGEHGSLAAGPDRTELIPAFQVQAVDTTGAGDAFIGSLAVFLSEGLPGRDSKVILQPGGIREGVAESRRAHVNRLSRSVKIGLS